MAVGGAGGPAGAMSVGSETPFKCCGCGKCCRWEGKVYVSPEDILELAGIFGMDVGCFVNQYTEPYGTSVVLKNKDGTTDCVFLDGDSCTVHGHHPRQCREWPVKYDERCPGFMAGVGEERMDYKSAVEQMNHKFSSLQQWDKSVTEEFYKRLMEPPVESKIASKALADGVDVNANSVKVASVDDLFAFHRVDEKHLVHKSTKDLWAIECDKDGGVRITRLFDNNGEPIKG